MKSHPRFWIWAAPIAGCAILLSTMLFAQMTSQPAGQAASQPQSEEYLLLGSPNRGAGEPFVYSNPKDRDNIIVAAMATMHRLPSGEAPLAGGGFGGARGGAPGAAPGAPGATPGARGGAPGAAPGEAVVTAQTTLSERTLLRVKELSVPDGSRTDIGITRDGGKTWQITEDNFRKFFNMNRCSDSFAGAGPDGTLYVGCLAYLYRGDKAFADGFNVTNGEARSPGGGSAIAWSKDKGKTWSNPVWVHPVNSPKLYPPNVHPVQEQVAPLDRPYFAADAQTNAIYVSGSGAVYTVDPATVQRPKVDPSLPGKGYTGYPPASVSRNRAFIRASHDQGKTWGIIYPMDSDEYPGGGGSFSAAFGNLAVVYGATKVPDSLGAQCPCTIFETSRDDGKTFDRKIVQAPPASPDAAAAGGRGGAGGGRGGGPGGGRASLGADSSNQNRYVIMRQSGRNATITVTEDGGKTWSKPVVATTLPEGASFGQSAFKVGPNGSMAMMWKQQYQDGTYDVWTWGSRDGGKTFKTIRMSHALSPARIRERGNFMMGDDLSSIEVDDQYVHAVWGDNRSGFLGTWYGRIPISAY